MVVADNRLLNFRAPFGELLRCIYNMLQFCRWNIGRVQMVCGNHYQGLPWGSTPPRSTTHKEHFMFAIFSSVDQFVDTILEIRHYY